MTGKDERDRKALDRLADALVDDILNMPDEEILAEFREEGGDPERHAADMRALFERSVLRANKRRMAAAKAGAAASRGSEGTQATGVVDIAEARARLRRLIEAEAIPGLTLAARKESELSDADVLGMLADLEELGVREPGSDDEKG